MDINTKIYETLANYLSDSALAIATRSAVIKNSAAHGELQEQYKEAKKASERSKTPEARKVAETNVANLEQAISKYTPISDSVGREREVSILAQRKNGHTAIVLPETKGQEYSGKTLVQAVTEELGEPAEKAFFANTYTTLVYQGRVSDKKIQNAAKAGSRALKDAKLECVVEYVNVDLRASTESYKPRMRTSRDVVDQLAKAEEGGVGAGPVSRATPAKTERAYTLDEAAALVTKDGKHYSASSLGGYVRKGMLTGKKEGNKIVVEHSALEDFAKRYDLKIGKPETRKLGKEENSAIIKALGDGLQPKAILANYVRHGYEIAISAIEAIKKQLGSDSYKKKKSVWDSLSEAKQKAVLHDLRTRCKTDEAKAKNWEELKAKHKIDGKTLQGVFLAYIKQGKGKK